MGGAQSQDSRGQYRPVPGSEYSNSIQAAPVAPQLAEPEDDVPSVVQFSCAMYFCQEAEGECTIDVVRLGDAHRQASVEFCTLDSSAKAGKKFMATSGRLDFEPDESMKQITVPLLNDDAWDGTLEFGVLLFNIQGARLGLYLNQCRVKIIDDDVFPTNVYDTALRSGQEAKIPGASLMWQYLRMNMRSIPIRNDSLKQVIADQTKGLYFILCLYLQMYLVDVVLNPHGSDAKERGEESEGGEDPSEGRRLLKTTIHCCARMLARSLGEENMEVEEVPGMMETLLVPGHRRETAIVIGVIWIVPFGLLHLIDLWKCYLRIPGMARKTLQANLLRRFLHYREDMRAKMAMTDTSEITMAMVRDVTEVVDFGYMKVLEVLRIFGKLLCALVFILAENKSAVIPLVVYPIILGLFLCCRERKTLAQHDRKAQYQDSVVQSVSDATNNYRVIADFQLRPMTVDNYEKRIDSYHEQESIMCAIITNNSYLSPWLTTLSIGLYICIGSYEVSTLGGPLSLGTFLATIHVFKDVGAEMQEIYGECLEIQRAFGPLRKICHFMNLDTDLVDRMRINRMRRSHGEQLRQRVRSSLSEGSQSNEIAADHVPIEVKNLSFQYLVGQPPVLLGVNLDFKQGQLYAFVGPPHEGKATLLKLLGQVLLPQDGCGTIFVPPHLRILHVSGSSHGSTVLATSLLQNLTLSQDMRLLGGPERVKRLCQNLGFSPTLLKVLDSNLRQLELENQDAAYQAEAVPSAEEEAERELPWTACLSSTDHCRLTLARVFLMNPECLVVHKPVMNFDENEKTKMLEKFLAHVNERGMELPENNRRWRRPRTVFFTSSTLAGVKIAHQVYRVCTEGVWPIRKDQVDYRLLQ